MAENTAIEWCDATFNPWEGCMKVGPGCDHCYAEARNKRYSPDGQPPNWGPGAPRRRTSESNWKEPLKWARKAEPFDRQFNRRQRVFCASLADVFDNEVVPAWRRDLFDLIAETPQLDWLLLTKRIGNVQSMLDEIGYPKLPGNVWLGATIVNQVEADRDIPKLLAMPAAVRFLSMEPLLGPVNLTNLDTMVYRGAERLNALTGDLSGMFGEPAGRTSGLDWIIVGGESGPGSRPMHPSWAKDLRRQCQEAMVPFLFKQWGEWAPADQLPRFQVDRGHSVYVDEQGGTHLIAGEGKAQMVRVGKKHAGRELDGRTWDGVPR